MREARVLGLFNTKNKKINTDITLEVITQLSLLPIEYNGNINDLIAKLDILAKQYPLYYNLINSYFKDTKIKYFRDDSYNYNKFPKDIRANSVLERYNKIVKRDLGEKRTCNWVIFLNFINNEIDRINKELIENQNVNVLYNMKTTKFGLDKYNNSDDIKISNKNNTNEIIENQKKNINEKWLIQKGNNCRYNAFITIFYFVITPYLRNIKNRNYLLLDELNERIIKLSEEVNDINFINIVIFLQKNKFDSNNAKIDAIINEQNEEKKEELIKQIKFDDSIDFTSSGYAAQLFSIFNNKVEFCIKENKTLECILCEKKITEKIEEIQPFVFVNNSNINNKSIFNLMLEKYKEIYSYACECRKNEKEDVLCLKIKYNIESYPEFLFILFDFQYSELVKNKENIYKLLDNTIAFNLKTEYKLVGIIAAPKNNHYNAIIFNPIGVLNTNFTANNIYYHDGMINNGRISTLKMGEDWKKIGIPYIALYKKLSI